MEDNDKRHAGRRITGPARSRITLWVVLTLAALLLLAAAAIGGYIWNGLRPAAAGTPKKVEITRGMSPFKIADLLERDGIIRSAFIFKYYLKYKEQGDGFKAGIYELAPGITHDGIISKLNSGDTVKEEMIRFTIPEGFTLLQ